MELPYEKQFHFHDGTSIASVDALQRKLASVSYEEFYRHVNPDKNDFASWIRHVFKDERLAEELERVTSIVETVEILNDYLHPRPVLAPMSDLQSRIEESVLGTAPLAHAVDAGMRVEEVPTTTPGAGTPERMDFRIIEENLSEEVAPATAAPAASQPVEQPPSMQYATPEAIAAHDHARMIVKDFLYGVFFGLIIGIIIGRIITF